MHNNNNKKTTTNMPNKKTLTKLTRTGKRKPRSKVRGLQSQVGSYFNDYTPTHLINRPCKRIACPAVQGIHKKIILKIPQTHVRKTCSSQHQNQNKTHDTKNTIYKIFCNYKSVFFSSKLKVTHFTADSLLSLPDPTDQNRHPQSDLT
jgi:hypothetical protein